MPTKQEMANRYTFSVELLVPESVKFTAADLMENVHDAIYAYDDAGRLFHGQKLADGHPCLIGTSVGLDKIERERFSWPPSESDFEPPPFWDRADADGDRATEISVAIDSKVEELREQQAQLWDAYNAAARSTEEKEFKRGLRRLKRLNKKLSPLLPGS